MVELKERVIIEPFGIEADGPRNNDIYMQCIENLRLRSTTKAVATVTGVQSGNQTGPIQIQAHGLPTLPQIPGMQLHVNPAKLSYVVSDPLHGDEELCERIRQVIKTRSPMRVGDKIDGVPTQRGTLDVHRMKSLCREMVWVVESGYAKVVKGSLPTLEQVEKLPGKFLTNPGSRIPNTQPRFEEDWDSWVSELQRIGG